ncbi:MAG: pyridoxamine 5'-phosphate oxidase family protein [Pseudomonadota bacterium]
MTDEIDPAPFCRRIIRAAGPATLATTAVKGKGGVGGPWPYASLVQTACDGQGNPLLLISDLADHTRNIRADARVSLLYDGTGGLDDPLTGPRVTLQGEAEQVEDGELMDIYLARHPQAKIYAGFKDFHLFRVRPLRAHLVAGFGRIHWIGAGELLEID